MARQGEGSKFDARGCMVKDAEIQMVVAHIISIAVDRMNKGEPYQDTNSAIHGVMMDIKQEIMEYMRYTK